MFGKKSKEDKWIKTAHSLYRKKKLPAPYKNLYYYYQNMSWKVSNHLNGHYDVFLWAKEDGFLDDLTKDLQWVLPQNLFENYSTALNNFLALGEDPEYEEIEKAYDECDTYVYEHLEEMENILRNYIERIKEI